MLPELFSRIKEAFTAWDTPITLGLKGDQFGFDLLPDPDTAKWNRMFRAGLGGIGPSWSGEHITNETAMNHSVVWCCRRIIAESVGAMPLELMQSKNDSKQPARTHPLYRIMHDEPNSDMSDMELRETLTDHVVAGGNAYGQIIRRSGTGTAVELWPLAPSAVKIDRDKNQRLVYIVKGSGEQEKSYTVEVDKPQDILHIRGLGSDGIRGYSVLTMARQSLGTALSAERYAAKFYAAGGRVPYLIEMSQKFKTTEDFERWRADWNKFYGSSDNWHQAAVMEPGMKYTQIGLSPEDSQFLETRQFEIPEICRWFLISPHMVGDLSHGTFSNIENLYLQYVKGTLNGWIRREEKAFWRCLLTPAEKEQGFYFKHNVNALLRGDFATRMAGYATALQNGHMSIDEVRDLEDRNALPNGAGKALHIQLNMATVPGTGQPMVAEQGILDRMAQTAASKGASNG